MKKKFLLLTLIPFMICGCSTNQQEKGSSDLNEISENDADVILKEITISPEDKLTIYHEDDDEEKSQKIEEKTISGKFEEYYYFGTYFDLSASRLIDFKNFIEIEYKVAKFFSNDEERSFCWASEQESEDFMRKNKITKMKETLSKPYFGYQYTESKKTGEVTNKVLVLKASETIPIGTTNLAQYVYAEEVDYELVKEMRLAKAHEISYYKNLYVIPKGAIVTKDYLVTIDTDIGDVVFSEKELEINVYSSQTPWGYLRVGQYLTIYKEIKVAENANGKTRSVYNQLTANRNVKFDSLVSGSFEEGLAKCKFVFYDEEDYNSVTFNLGGKSEELSLFFGM